MLLYQHAPQAASKLIEICGLPCVSTQYIGSFFFDADVVIVSGNKEFLIVGTAVEINPMVKIANNVISKGFFLKILFIIISPPVSII